MKRVVLFSGGIGSWMTARRVAERHGTKNLILLFTDTAMEDEDLYRFLCEAAADVGGELVWLRDGRTPWDVFFDVRYLGNTRIDPCSRILKREAARSWIEKNCKPEKTVVYVGIDWSEEHRYEAAAPRWLPWKLKAPLCDPPYMTKKSMQSALVARGIRPPFLYSIGFPHNNCFAGETKFITREGVCSFKQTVGQQVEVIGRRGAWKKASIKSFGIQKLRSVVVNGSEIHATGSHRWLCADGNSCTTDSLLEGSALATVDQSDCYVQRVEDTAREEEVYCAVVPDGHVFSLAGNILTGNCAGFCVKAGMAHFRLLLEKLPERYRYHEEKEQALREYLGKDVAILRDRRGGESTPLTLRAFRERVQAGEKTDPYEWGGCACFTPDDPVTADSTVTVEI